jgi:hypothetical protein
VRRAFLLSEGPLDRREWIENRVEQLVEIFAAAIVGFSVIDNDLHDTGAPRPRPPHDRCCALEGWPDSEMSDLTKLSKPTSQRDSKL